MAQVAFPFTGSAKRRLDEENAPAVMLPAACHTKRGRMRVRPRSSCTPALTDGSFGAGTGTGAGAGAGAGAGLGLGAAFGAATAALTAAPSAQPATMPFGADPLTAKSVFDMFAAHNVKRRNQSLDADGDLQLLSEASTKRARTFQRSTGMQPSTTPVVPPEQVLKYSDQDVSLLQHAQKQASDAAAAAQKRVAELEAQVAALTQSNEQLQRERNALTKIANAQHHKGKELEATCKTQAQQLRDAEAIVDRLRQSNYALQVHLSRSDGSAAGCGSSWSGNPDVF